MTVHEVLAAISKYRYRHSTEEELQRALSQALDRFEIPHDREVRLAPRDRIDFLCHGGIGIEVKVKGSASAAAAQMLRYAKSDRVTALILVTDRTQAGDQPEELNGKPVLVFQVMGGVL